MDNIKMIHLATGCRDSWRVTLSQMGQTCSVHSMKCSSM